MSIIFSVMFAHLELNTNHFCGKKNQQLFIGITHFQKSELTNKDIFRIQILVCGKMLFSFEFRFEGTKEFSLQSRLG